MEDKSKAVPKIKKRKDEIETHRDTAVRDAEMDHNPDLANTERKKKKKAKKNKKERTQPRDGESVRQTISKGNSNTPSHSTWFSF